MLFLQLIHQGEVSILESLHALRCNDGRAVDEMSLKKREMHGFCKNELLSCLNLDGHQLDVFLLFKKKQLSDLVKTAGTEVNGNDIDMILQILSGSVQNFIGSDSGITLLSYSCYGRKDFL